MEQHCDRGRNAVDQADLANFYLRCGAGCPGGDQRCTARTLRCFDEFSRRSSFFDQFLRGDSLESCYAAVAECSNAWLDILEHRGAGMRTCASELVHVHASA